VTRDKNSDDRLDPEKVGKEPAEQQGGPQNEKDKGNESLEVQLLVQAQDGLIPIEAMALCHSKSRRLGLID
jgi:hypothetical protein